MVWAPRMKTCQASLCYATAVICCASHAIATLLGDRRDCPAIAVYNGAYLVEWRREDQFLIW